MSAPGPEIYGYVESNREPNWRFIIWLISLAGIVIAISIFFGWFDTLLRIVMTFTLLAIGGGIAWTQLVKAFRR